MHPLILKDIIELVTTRLKLENNSATNLLLGTAAIESHCGKWFRQKGLEDNRYDGAFGIFQMELKTHTDIWNFVILKKQLFLDVTGGLRIDTLSDEYNLMYNIPYAVAMTRLHYWRFPESLPDADDIEGLARYWKKYYNTELGKGTIDHFIECYNKYILI
ncbi:MAG: hypothetical protein FK731_06310 [Asgard group archaeon]|nr:hypothetical protein [Asgard group archaeon]